MLGGISVGVVCEWCVEDGSGCGGVGCTCVY